VSSVPSREAVDESLKVLVVIPGDGDAASPTAGHE
jgi:hypothetical protein